MTAAMLLSLDSLSQQLTALLLQYKPLMDQCRERFKSMVSVVIMAYTNALIPKSSCANQGRRYVVLHVRNVRPESGNCT